MKYEPGDRIHNSHSFRCASGTIVEYAGPKHANCYYVRFDNPHNYTIGKLDNYIAPLHVMHITAMNISHLAGIKHRAKQAWERGDVLL